MPENPRPTLIATDAPAADAREAAARKRATALNAGHRLSRFQRRSRAMAICPIRFDNRQGDEMIMPASPATSTQKIDDFQAQISPQK